MAGVVEEEGCGAFWKIPTLRQAQGRLSGNTGQKWGTHPVFSCGKIPTQANTGLEWGTRFILIPNCELHFDAVVVFGEAGFGELEF